MRGSSSLACLSNRSRLSSSLSSHRASQRRHAAGRRCKEADAGRKCNDADGFATKPKAGEQPSRQHVPTSSLVLPMAMGGVSMILADPCARAGHSSLFPDPRIPPTRVCHLSRIWRRFPDSRINTAPVACLLGSLSTGGWGLADRALSTRTVGCPARVRTARVSLTQSPLPPPTFWRSESITGKAESILKQLS